MRPLAIDLFCGLGGWAEGLLAEGWRVVGFDIERHDYGTGSYPGQLVLQDVTTLHGSQFKDASLIVASPPCQEFSCTGLPFKQFRGLVPNTGLFDTCFRIQREASMAAGCHVPLIVENVVSAQKWVGRAQWKFGSFCLWGDVPALMPIRAKTEGRKLSGNNSPRNWSERRNQRLCDGWKQDENYYMASSSSRSRKAASAQIAKIPFPLAQHIATVFYPKDSTLSVDDPLLEPQVL